MYRFDAQHGKEILPLTFQRDSATGKTAWRWQALPAPGRFTISTSLRQIQPLALSLLEGEKAGGRSRLLFPECVTTTTLNGAKSPHKTDFSSLQGRIVWIWPDNDKAGRQYAERVGVA